MAEGDALRYKEIKRMDALGEFWDYLDMWRAKQERIINTTKNRK